MIVHVHYYFCKIHMVIKIFVLYMVLIDVLVDSYATKKSKTNFFKNESEMDELSWVMFYVPSQNSMILIVAL